MDLEAIIATVDARTGARGFGRLDMVESRRVGIKSREVYECPGALALLAAHADLEDLTLERDVHHEKARLEPRWAELVYDGLWYSPLKRALDAFIAETQRHVTGEVRLTVSAPGVLRVVGRRSPVALYDHGLATYDAADTFRHADAEGFVRLWGLGVQTWAARQEVGGAAPGPRAVTLWSGRLARAARRRGPRVHREPRPSTWRSGASTSPGPRPTSRGLRQAGLLTTEEADALTGALDAVAAEFADGTFAFAATDEDVHTAVERRVTELAGPVGHKLHTARSRNDQVASDLRLWTREAIGALGTAVLLARRDARERAPRRPATPTCRATPTCSAPSPSCSPTTSGRTPGRSCATSTGSATPRRGPTSRRSGPVRSRAARCRVDPAVAAPSARLRRDVRQQPRRGERPRLRRRAPVLRRPARGPPVADGGGADAVDQRPSSASPRSTTATPPAARCCPRRRTPTWPSSHAARPVD